jgi:hypothetical protein
MATIQELKKLYKETKYREIIAAVSMESPNPRRAVDAEKLLLVAWAYHQLGDYKKSLIIFEELLMIYVLSTELEIYHSAARGVAHGLLQSGGDFARVEKLINVIPPDLSFDNVFANAAIIKARKCESISAEIVLGRIIFAIKTVPYKTINGHVINNGTFALFEARQQEAVKPYLPILPGLIFNSINIYYATGTAKNHLAGAAFRASQICEAAGWKNFAKTEAETSVRLWREIIDSQDGERYKSNLEGALAQLARVTTTSGK